MRKFKASTWRAVSVLVFVGLTGLGLAFRTGTGTLCAIGYRTIAAVCPLGALEAMVASRTLLPWALVSLVVALLVAALLGRVFCAWICPAPLLRGWILGGKQANDSGIENGLVAPPSELHPEGELSGVSLDSRHLILGGALLSTAIFGFPVFCLICPVGLTFATFIGLWRLIQHNEPSWTLLVFPAVLVLELVVFRKWCRKFCPLGALVSLLSGLNLWLRPKVDANACRRIAKGADCSLCKAVCAEEIDLHQVRESQPLAECTKCRECADVCPAGAITFPWFAKREKERR